jgi:hypothetical protein
MTQPWVIAGEHRLGSIVRDAAAYRKHLSRCYFAWQQFFLHRLAGRGAGS